MHRFLFVISTLIFFIVKTNVSSKSRGIRENYCSRLEQYDEQQVIPETKRVLETTKKICWSFKIFCTNHEYKTVTVNKTVTVHKFKKVFDCCPGYEKENEACIPICKKLCHHGLCVEPDTCLCEPGWREPYCIDKCEPNRFGKGCKGVCTCLHGECDHKTGACHCTKGYTGYNCHLPCPKDTYGQDCKSRCKCKNNAMCDIVDGTCDCKPGYEGEYCEKPCKNGKHGQDCEKYCICIPETTESCHHVDGKCNCKPGYKGESCEEECDDFFYGKNCSNKCNCVNSEFCDSVSGECYCKPGWIGESCSEKCPLGKFGEDCSYECTDCLNISGHCDHITGFCLCPPGRYGILCEEECPSGYWGSNCIKACRCAGNKSCNPENGACALGAVCPSGYWGSNCSNACSCAGNKNCNPENGACALGSEEQEHKKYGTKYMLPISVCGIIGIIVLCIVIVFLKYDKKKLEYLNYSPWFSANFLKRKQRNERISDSAINNPVYECPDVVLETEQNGDGFIRGTYTSGIKYTKQINNFDAEIKQSNVQKADEVPEEVKNITDSKDSDLKKAHVLNDIKETVKEIKRRSIRASLRNSKAKTNSIDSSTAELDEDFQPEVLDDFNIIENIYEKPPANVTEDIYDNPASIEAKNLSVKEDILNNLQ